MHKLQISLIHHWKGLFTGLHFVALKSIQNWSRNLKLKIEIFMFKDACNNG